MVRSLDSDLGAHVRLAAGQGIPIGPAHGGRELHRPPEVPAKGELLGGLHLCSPLQGLFQLRGLQGNALVAAGRGAPELFLELAEHVGFPRKF